ncbi:MAG TPA: cbb3-type cytochrome oxidase assembly protein CcoS [Bacteroidetes bacterium]|nr:cbb3-type cytochrome oxidase assembly protein CcoS [Bacteroidota bacterium]
MTIIFILIGCSLLLALGFLIAFIWSVKSGQIDDTSTPAYRILEEESED